MAHLVVSVELRRSRGKIVLHGMGRTARGQKYLIEQVELDAADMLDPNLKSELKSAVEKLLAPQAALSA